MDALRGHFICVCVSHGASLVDLIGVRGFRPTFNYGWRESEDCMTVAGVDVDVEKHACKL